MINQSPNIVPVHWIESVESATTLQALYKHAMFLVYPSLYEGFGLPIVESLLSGTAVITSNISSMPEAGGLGALLVDPKDDAAIAHAMDLLSTDSVLRRQMEINGYQYVREAFDPERVTTQMIGLYRSLLR
jgi:glycosyltransferase involved in cell wall biosynthesis